MILDLNLVTITIIPVFAFFSVSVFVALAVGFVLSFFDMKKDFSKGRRR